MLKLKKEKILKMPWEEVLVYLKNNLVRDCMEEFGLEKSLPQLVKFEQKEVNV